MKILVAALSLCIVFNVFRITNSFYVNEGFITLLEYSQGQTEAFDSAQQYFRAAVGHFPSDARAHRGMGQMYVMAKKFGLAANLLQTSIQLDPTDQLGHFWLGWGHIGEDRQQEAFREWRKAGVSPYFWHLGQQSERQHNFQKAQRYYTWATRIEPTAKEPLYSLVDLFLAQGRIEDAITSLSKVSALEKVGSEEYYLARGDISRLKRQWDLAKTSYEQALVVNSRNWRIYYRLGSVLYEMGKDEQATAYFQEAVRICTGEECILVHLWIGQFYSRHKDYSNARHYYRKAARLSPGDGRPFLYLGVDALAQDSFTQAIGLFNEAIALNSDNPGYYYYLAKAYLGLNKFDMAQAAVKHAIRLEPNSLLYHRLLARIYQKAGQYDIALAEYEIVLTLAPHDKEAKRAIEELRREQGDR